MDGDGGNCDVLMVILWMVICRWCYADGDSVEGDVWMVMVWKGCVEGGVWIVMYKW